MQVTDVRVRLIASESRLRGIATVTFNESFVVHDIRVIEGENGLFVAMPSKKMPNGQFRDIAHPITTEMRQEVESAIIAAYEKALTEDKPEEE